MSHEGRTPIGWKMALDSITILEAQEGAMTTSDIFFRLQTLYADMEREYRRIAELAGLTCAGCTDNCCTSYFQHHTHVEWAYLWNGLRDLPRGELENLRVKAGAYVYASRETIARQHVPNLMCPLNSDGLCTLYAHRLMICRLHGVPNRFTLPDGRTRTFPGCFRCPEYLADQKTAPVLDRTGFYRRLAELEMEYLKNLPTRPARIRLTLAEMILKDPPQ